MGSGVAPGVEVGPFVLSELNSDRVLAGAEHGGYIESHIECADVVDCLACR